MSIVYNAAKFIDMKTRIKAEVNRRKYKGSLTSYGTATYDFTVTPAVGELVRAEHYNKIAEPIRAINQTGIVGPTTAGSPVEDVSTPEELDAKITLYASKSLTTSNHGCAASCSGLCSSTCSGGCSGSCSGCSGCGSSCTGECSGCSGCWSQCSDGCTSCSGSVSSECLWENNKYQLGKNIDIDEIDYKCEFNLGKITIKKGEN